MKKTNSKIGLILGLIMVLIFISGCEPPAQPDSGPGGKDYSYDTLLTPYVVSDPNLEDITLPGLPDVDPDDPEYAAYEQRIEIFTELEYTIYAPNDSDTTFPVVLFLHGNGGDDPKYYELWIKHIVKKGNIVIYPRYQNIAEDESTSVRERYLISAICAAKLALNELNNLTIDDVKVNADPDKFALIGHSLGGSFAAYIAATYQQTGLPEPDVLLLADPTDANLAGGNPMPLQVDLPVNVPEYSEETELFSGSGIYGDIPSSTLFLSILAAFGATEPIHDWTREVFIKSGAEPQNKNMIVMLSDRHGDPNLIANHFAPNAIDADNISEGGALEQRLLENQGGVNALDYYGYWKLFDGLCGAAFDDDAAMKNYALWNGEGTAPPEEQTFLGTWSDDTPVTPLIVFSGEDTPPASRLTETAWKQNFSR